MDDDRLERIGMENRKNWKTKTSLSHLGGLQNLMRWISTLRRTNTLDEIHDPIKRKTTKRNKITYFRVRKKRENGCDSSENYRVGRNFGWKYLQTKLIRAFDRSLQRYENFAGKLISGCIPSTINSSMDRRAKFPRERNRVTERAFPIADVVTC